MFDARKQQEQLIYNAVITESDKETAEWIISGKSCDSFPENNEEWVKNTMDRLEYRFNADVVNKIRMNCQCGYAMDEKLKFLNTLISASASLEEFANHESARAAGLFTSNGELFLQFDYCPCPILSEVEKLDKNTWCLCTTGYSKVLFEKAFNCQVEVELLNSIKMGDSKCLMKLILACYHWS